MSRAEQIPHDSPGTFQNTWCSTNMSKAKLLKGTPLIAQKQTSNEDSHEEKVIISFHPSKCQRHEKNQKTVCQFWLWILALDALHDAPHMGQFLALGANKNNKRQRLHEFAWVWVELNARCQVARPGAHQNKWKWWDVRTSHRFRVRLSFGKCFSKMMLQAHTRWKKEGAGFGWGVWRG